ncbi:lysophospholipase catalytic domain-containing protein [Amylocarpus encephaloides]|uniref:Lysophospholipase n=1 Tax=Amylocarpus encephaloides TaxID=45428 RepID=A0A9P7YR45_9HELO|nr:lysophospholipase catalytic domain-containing protein [Amylocarpus encephaloides]
MKGLLAVLALAASLKLCNGAIVAPRDASPEVLAAEALAAPMILADRAIPNSPSGGYTPGAVDCPSTRPTVRLANSLSPSETAWLQKRRPATVDPMITWLSRMNISGFDAATYINTHKANTSLIPNIGIAASGGGYRALLNGAGFLAAADSRTHNSTNKGQIGGLLQATTYVAGLSGGSWLVGSMYSNNFSSVETLRDGSKGSSVWKYGNSIFEGPDTDSIQVLSTADYFRTISDQVSGKANAGLGFNSSITDYWGRALSFQLINATSGGPAYTFSSIALADNFVNGEIPFPLIVADERSPNTQIVSLNSTVYEFNPFEMGSWDPTTYGFVPTEYLGTNFSGGSVVANQQCVRGFDNAGYVMGTSSTLFNQFLLQIDNQTAIPTFLRNIFTGILTGIGEVNNDIAQYQPNPFFGFNNGTNRNSGETELTLVDGGEDLQNIPLYPLIQPNREVDVIFAIDSSADTEDVDTHTWPNGASLVATYRRSLNATIENSTAFPSIPSIPTFVNLGLNNRPTFFGCNATNITAGQNGMSPLIVYLPNAPYVFNSNITTFTAAYNNTVRNAMIENGYDVATMGNGTLDAEWPTCMACAVLSRSFTKTGTAPPPACNTCFQRYCWNGTTDSSTPASYEPTFKLAEINVASAATATMNVAKLGVYAGALVATVAIMFV